MDKKKYFTPFLQIDCFSEDIVRTSGNNRFDNIIDGSGGDFVFGDGNSEETQP